MQYIENIKRPIKKGEYFLVPCIIGDMFGKIDITPIINHPHNDKENGQSEIHYHADYRFIKHENDSDFPTVINNHSEHVYAPLPRIIKSERANIEYILLTVINEKFAGITPSHLIKNSKFKHSCIKNNKCPHRGYDLSQVPIINGKITCPLHGLRFNAETGKLTDIIVQEEEKYVL